MIICCAMCVLLNYCDIEDLRPFDLCYLIYCNNKCRFDKNKKLFFYSWETYQIVLIVEKVKILNTRYIVLRLFEFIFWGTCVYRFVTTKSQRQLRWERLGTMSTGCVIKTWILSWRWPNSCSENAQLKPFRAWKIELGQDETYNLGKVRRKRVADHIVCKRGLRWLEKAGFPSLQWNCKNKGSEYTKQHHQSMISPWRTRQKPNTKITTTTTVFDYCIIFIYTTWR